MASTSEPIVPRGREREPRRDAMSLLVLEPDPSHGGGSEAVTLSLSRELARRGHRIVLLHEALGTMLPDYAQFAADIIRQPLPGFALRAPLRTLDCVMRIGSLARKLGVDAVVSSHLGFIRHGALVQARHGIPFLFHLGLPSVGSSRVLRTAYRRMGAGVAPSAHTRMSWEQGGWPADTLHAIRNWVDPQRFRPCDDVAALRRELQMPGDGECVVFVGRVCAQKGVDVLIQAFALLGPGDDAHLVIVGTIAPDFRAPLEALLGALDPHVRSRVVLRPVTPNPEKYYAAADVACAPSLGDESFGLTVLEAMACGVPVVSSALGIIPRILGDGHSDLLVPAGDPASLAACLQSWLGRPKAARIECGRQLRERVMQSYLPDASIDAYEDVLAKMVAAVPNRWHGRRR